MAYKKLTETGKMFIKHVGDVASNKGLLEGNNGLLPYSNTTNANKVWKANVIDIRTNSSISTNSQITEYLIYLFDTYSEQYELDSNIIAAQAYQESRYKCWIYNDNISTASAISQIVMNTVYEILYNKRWLTDEERDIITNGMENPDRKSSWRKVLKKGELIEENYVTQKANRSILHQNMIDNPHIIIKMQCVLMDFISGRNANLASSSLFGYNRGSGLSSNNYIEMINLTAKEFGDNYSNEGIKYTEHIFGYLGDKDNKYVTGLDSLTKGYWFGYSLDLDKKNWSEFEADSKSNFVPTRSTKTISAIDRELRLGYEGAKIKFKEAHGDTYIVNLTSVYRTPAHQNRLYQKGRSPQGTIVGPTLTPINGFNRKSKHNYFKTKAFDYGIYTNSNLYLDGKKNLIYRSLYEEFARYVIEIVPNAVWGGNFINQKNDVVHIQLN